MRLAIRPPEFLPRLEYFALMCHVDVFVVADTFQYSRQSYHNRTKLRTPHGWQWQSIPVVGGQHGRSIHETRISDDPVGWRRKLWRSLEYNYRSTPFFEYLEDDLKSVLDAEVRVLGAYTFATVGFVHDLLKLPAQLARTSYFAAEARSVSDIVGHFQDARLVTLEDAANVDAAVAADIEVLHFDPPAYRQNFSGFEHGMSSVDALFNIGPQATREMLVHAIR